jgi:hypothetical protein
MQDPTKDPYSPEELEYRSQRLLAQRLQARLLFHCYAEDLDDASDDADDVYYPYYAEGAER